MPSRDQLINRFPEHELAIRRLYARDQEFRDVCDDYCAVQRALAHVQASDPALPGRVAEYRLMLDELEAEALTFVTAFGAR